MSISCRRNWAASLALLAIAVTAKAAVDEAPILKPGARVAITGDSITEQRLYSKYMEIYLTACTPQLNLKIVQLGWSGEQSWGLAQRMDNDLLPWKPDVVTTCYGMNDGYYMPYKEETGKTFAQYMTQIVKKLKDAGATVIVGSPGAVDPKYFKMKSVAPDVYNEALGKLGEVAAKVAADAGMRYADLHGPMMATMEKAKAALGEDYEVTGHDGFHPGPNGHLIMASVFLKALGLNGEIATITVDMKGQTTASDGHAVVSAKDGVIELDSTRYPFCFIEEEQKAQGGKPAKTLKPDTASILPYLPFNKDLNRFMLIVKNLDGEKAAVKWGETSKSFSKKDLEAGVNLADAFLKNPFVESFKKVHGVVTQKQEWETTMIKEHITRFNAMKSEFPNDAEADAAFEVLRKKWYAKHDLMSSAVRTAMTPVKHTITITVEK